MPSSNNRLEETLASLLQRRQSRSQLRRLTVVSPGLIDFSSNAYLSLSTNREIQREFVSRLKAELEASPTLDANPTNKPARTRTLLGSGGSRLLDGNSPFAEDVERRITAFHGAPAGLLFNSAFDANVGLFSCVPQPGDIIVYDELIHASVHDGMRLSRAGRRVPFRHNCVHPHPEETRSLGTGIDVRECLDEILLGLTAGDDGIGVREGKVNVFVAVEGLYSMDGDLPPLKEIIECVERRLPEGNGHVIVDEAHSTGIFGDRGRGLVSHLGLEDRVFARVHGFGKAMSCAGGIVLCSPTTRHYLINYARSLIYTTSMAYPSLLSIETTYEFLISGRAESLVRHLNSLISHTHKLLIAICNRHRPPGNILHVRSGLPRSPIIPVLTSNPRDLASHCQSSGFMVRPIVAPTVPAGSERIRICLHAGNSFDEVEGLCQAVEFWVISQMKRHKLHQPAEQADGSLIDLDNTTLGKAKL